MECARIEALLSEYLERSLPAQDMAQIAAHLHECGNCSALLEEMRSLVLTCKAFPVMEPDVELIERILLRTSGKPRTRSWRERLSQYVLQPMLTPRFALGATLAVLFLALAVNLMLPRIAVVASVLSPKEMFRHMDRGVQQIYARGLKAYDKKNEWQAQFGFIKNNVFNKLGFMIERLDVPVEGKKKPGEPRQQREKSPSQKSSVLLLPA
jgi:Putative zinc-finger